MKTIPLVIYSLPAAAERDGYSDETLNSRWYLGMGGGFSGLKPDAGSVSYTVTDRQDSAWNLITGFAVIINVSAEVRFNHLGKARLEPSAEVIYKVFGISAVMFTNPLLDHNNDRKGFRVFGRIGTGKLINDSKVNYKQKNGYHLLSGLGLECALTGPLAARIEYTRYDRDAHYAGISLILMPGQQREYKTTPIVLPIEPEIPVQAFVAEDLDQVFDDEFRSLEDLNTNTVPDCQTFTEGLERITINSASADLTHSSKMALSQLADQVNAYPDVHFKVMAHTDSVGSRLYNFNLSEKRAQSVVAYLIQQGVSTIRLTYEAFGEDQPIATNETTEGRSENRRAEFETTQMSQSAYDWHQQMKG